MCLFFTDCNLEFPNRQESFPSDPRLPIKHNYLPSKRVDLIALGGNYIIKVQVTSMLGDAFTLVSKKQGFIPKM